MDDKLKIEEVVEIASQMEQDGKERRERYRKIDEAVACKFTPDANVAALPFVSGRQFALTDIADARNAGVRTFSSLLPDIRISPVMDNQGEYDRVDRMEQAWKWELEKMNRPINGKKGIHDQIVESAITYHAVALQTEYLPYKFKGKEKNSRIQSMLSRKCFNWTVHHPGTVEAKYSDYGLECVLKKGDFTAQQMIDNFGRDNEGIAKMLEDNNGKSKAELMKLKFTLWDFTDWTNRVQYITPSDSKAKRYELMNEKHGLPFIPWVVVDYGDPLWQAVIDSGHWNNLQHLKLIKFSKAVALGMRSDLVVETPDGTLKGVWIDYQNPTNPIVIPAGSNVRNLPANNLDPQFESEYQEARSDVSRSTVAKVLQDITPYMNSPFSSLNAGITMALGQLSPARRVAEAAEAEAIYQGFQWIKHSKMPFYAFRKKNSDGKIEGGSPYMAGGHIMITHEEPPTEEQMQEMNDKEIQLAAKKIYFDLEHLYINVELQSSNVTDEQAKMNLYINAMREAGMSKKEVWERMNWDGFEMNQIQRGSEVLYDAELGKLAKLKDLEVSQIAQQAQMQQAQMAQAQQAQAQQMQTMQNATNDLNAASQFAGMEGVDMRGGGMAAAMGAPNETRETITGRTMGGDAIL